MAERGTIGIVHYRVGRTDGVSLEIEKRRQILTDLGYNVILISGPLEAGADRVIPELEFDTPFIRAIKENSFAFFNHRSMSDKHLMEKIEFISSAITKQFLALHAEYRFSALLVHNIYSHGRHIAAASAFSRIAKQLGIPIIATNHDYYWERDEYQQSTSSLIEDYLQSYVPPALANVHHISINSLAAGQLKSSRKIDSTVLPDIFDFDQPMWQADSFNLDFRKHIGMNSNDLLILQATRVVERKAIELAVDFVREINKRKTKLTGKKLYNGRILTPESKVVFVLAGYAEKSAKAYLHKILNYAKEQQIEILNISEMIGSKRSEGLTKKQYSLWDAYVHADVITYPSLVEGWGNQFIEAVFARKPVVLFEYPVFKADIKPEGYHYVSLGDMIAATDEDGLVHIAPEANIEATERLINWLTDAAATQSHLDANFAIGARNHGFPVMREYLERKLIQATEDVINV
jgi:glycosyltransferase involved in cell wall biosynthesis